MNDIIDIVGIRESEVTVVRPIRVEEKNEYLIDRISNHKYDHNILNNVSFLIVDDGSSCKYSKIIKQICIDNNIGYIKIDTEEKLFSPARARNIGSIYAKSKFIFMQDIDLYPYDNFYNDLIKQISIQGLYDDESKFIMISCIYLNKDGIEFLDNGNRDKYSMLLNMSILGDDRYIERLSNGTSICLFNRDHFLRMGGYYETFEGWGYEDLELNCRMIRKAKIFSLPDNWSKDIASFNTIYEYSGWKSIYRLYADLSMRHGLVLFHGTHIIEKNISRERLKVKNYSLFNSNLKILKNPHPLPDIYCGNTLILKKCAFTMNNDIISWYGNIYLMDDYDINTIEEFIKFLKIHNINRVVFMNPYANDFTMHIYKYVKKSNIEYVICERGALPKSFFFDFNGFLYDSDAYNEKNGM